MLRLVLAVLLFVFITIMAIQPMAAGLTTSPGHHESTKLNAHLSILEDPSRQLTIEHIKSPAYENRFLTDKTDKTYLGYSTSNWWLRFDISLPSPESWYLLLDHPQGQKAELFIYPKHTLPETHEPRYQLMQGHRTPAWKLDLPPEESFTAYLKVNGGQELLYLPLYLMTSDDFIPHSNYRYLFYAAILSGFTVLTLYNLFLCVSLREASYLSLITFMMGVQCGVYKDSNLFSNDFIFNNSGAWYYSVPYLMAMFAGFTYWRQINEGESPGLEKLLHILQWSALPVLLVTTTWFDSMYPLYLAAAVLSPLLLILITQVVISGHPLSRSNYWSVFALLVSITIYMTPRIGIFTEYMVVATDIGQTGMLTGILLLSIAQADRSHLLREQAEHAEASRQSANNFLTTMNHELRTPMHAVLALSELLKKTVHTPEQQDYLKKLSATSNHMLDLMDNVLDLSKMNSDHYPKPGNKPFNLNDLLTDLENLFYAVARQKNLQLNIEQLPDFFPLLMGSKKQLNQVLVNLMANALKYTDSGHITLQVKAHKLNNTTMNVHFSVTDTGIGITPEQQSQLFQPFYQADGENRQQRGGAGLGLAISQKLLKSMGAHLHLQSTPGAGSEFFFSLELPICEERRKDNKQTQVLPVPEEELPLQGVKILLVDDDELNCFIGQEYLSYKGADVVLANSGMTAITLVQQQSFDLIFMDINMPEMNGYETTQKIRSEVSIRKLPIVALTAHALEGERERCLAAGMNGYLTKPFNMETLTDAVKRFTNVAT